MSFPGLPQRVALALLWFGGFSVGTVTHRYLKGDPGKTGRPAGRQRTVGNDAGPGMRNTCSRCKLRNRAAATPGAGQCGGSRHRGGGELSASQGTSGTLAITGCSAPTAGAPRSQSNAIEWYRVNVKTFPPPNKRRSTATGMLVGTRFQPGLLEGVDQWRKLQSDLPTRPEAVRRLIQQALQEPAEHLASAGSAHKQQLRHAGEP